MADSTRRLRIGSAGNITRQVGQRLLALVSEARCSSRHSAQKICPLVHWCTCPAGRLRQMAQS